MTTTKLDGFSSMENSKLDLSFVTVVHSMEFCGKTRFGLTMPKNVGYLVNDPKTLETLSKDTLELGIDPATVLKTNNMSRLDNVMDSTTTIKSAKELESSEEARRTMEAYRNHINLTKSRNIALVRHPDIVSGVIDSGTITYEDVCYAHCGRNSQIDPLKRPQINREFMDILELWSGARTRKGRRKHLLVTARSKEVYNGDRKTGRFEAEGCSKIGYFVKNVIELCKINDKKDWDNLNARMVKSGRKPPAYGQFTYYMNLQRSLFNPKLATLEGYGILFDDEISYPSIMSLIYGDAVPYEEWF